MSLAKPLNVDRSNLRTPPEMDGFLESIIAEGMKRVHAETAELQARGLMDKNGNLLTNEIPEDMREGSERDFGG